MRLPFRSLYIVPGLSERPRVWDVIMSMSLAKEKVLLQV